MLVNPIHGIAAIVSDPFLTPLRWNAIGDAMLYCSSYASNPERNTLVRGFNDEKFFEQYAGTDFERAARRAVGMFRRYMAGDPSPFAQEIFERIRLSSMFQRLWNERVVADELYEDQTIMRHHPEVGTYIAQPLDLYLRDHDNLVLKLWFPANPLFQYRVRPFNRI